MELHTIQSHTPRKQSVRIGRGGKRGKTSGKGMKGQKSRTGNSMRPEIRDMIKRFPKLRGHGKNRARTVNNERKRALVVNISALESLEAGTKVTPLLLVEKNFIRARGDKAPFVKILGDGELTKKLTIAGCVVSKSAREKITALGGTIE